MTPSSLGNKVAELIVRLTSFLRRNRIKSSAAVLAVLAFGFAAYLQVTDYDRYEQALRQRAPSGSTAAGSSFVASASNMGSANAPLPPIAVEPIGDRFCQALAPAGWVVNDQDDAGAVLGVTSSDGRLASAYGSFGISAVMRGGGAALMNRLNQIAPYLPPPQPSPDEMGAQYQDPVTAVEFVIRKTFGDDIQFEGAPDAASLSYQLLRFSGSAKRGIVVFRVFTDDQQNQAVLMRIGVADAAANDSDLSIAMAVSTSINCRQALKPPPPPSMPDSQSASPDRSNASQKCQVWSPNCDDSDFAGTYNAQIGVGYVHSASGHNYLRDPDTQKWENGPDGPGYYIHHDNGNWEKLQPGWVDPD